MIFISSRPDIPRSDFIFNDGGPTFVPLNEGYRLELVPLHRLTTFIVREHQHHSRRPRPGRNLAPSYATVFQNRPRIIQIERETRRQRTGVLPTTLLKTTVKCACELKPITAATLAIDN